MEHTRVELAGGPETLLWNLYQRATEARRPDRVRASRFDLEVRRVLADTRAAPWLRSARGGP